MMRTPWELIRFGTVGVINTLLDFAVFVLLFRGLDLAPLFANSLSFLVAASNSYLMNHRWTFRSAQPLLSAGAYIRFLAFNSGGLFIGSAAILLLRPYMPLELAKLLAVGLTLLWNFTTTKAFVFHERG